MIACLYWLVENNIKSFYEKRYVTKLLLLCLFVATQCSEDYEIKESRTREAALKFNFGGTEKIVLAQMVFNESLNRIQLISDEIVEIEALNEITREIIYVYTLKSEVNRRSTSAKMEEPWEVKVGYYGYSGGCYYFGTLYVDDNGTDLFVLATGTNAIANPPICDGGEWA